MPRCQSHTHRTTMGPTQTHGYMHTTEEKYKCTHKSNTHKIMGVSVHGCTSLIPKKSPPPQTAAPQPSILAKQSPGLPHQLYPHPGLRQALSCLPRPAWVGFRPLPVASCQLSTGHGALWCWLLHVAGPTPSS